MAWGRWQAWRWWWRWEGVADGLHAWHQTAFQDVKSVSTMRECYNHSKTRV